MEWSKQLSDRHGQSRQDVKRSLNALDHLNSWQDLHRWTLDLNLHVNKFVSLFEGINFSEDRSEFRFLQQGTASKCTHRLFKAIHVLTRCRTWLNIWSTCPMDTAGDPSLLTLPVPCHLNRFQGSAPSRPSSYFVLVHFIISYSL